MTTTRLLIAAFAATLTVASFTGPLLRAEEDSTSAPEPTHARIGARLAEKLDLTPGQKAEIKTILGVEKDVLKALVTRMHDARIAERSAIQAPDANETSVRAAAAKVAAAEADLAVERMKVYGKISPVLTDEQHRKLSELMQRADDFTDASIDRIGGRLSQ